MPSISSLLVLSLAATAVLATPGPSQTDSWERSQDVDSRAIGSLGKGILSLVTGLAASTAAGGAIDEIKSLFRREDGLSPEELEFLQILAERNPGAADLDSRAIGSLGKGILSLVTGLAASTAAGGAIDEIKSLFRRGDTLSPEELAVLQLLVSRDLEVADVDRRAIGSLGKGILSLVTGLAASTAAGGAIDEIKSLFRRDDISECFALSAPTAKKGPGLSPFAKCLAAHGARVKRDDSGRVADAFHSVFGRELTDDDADMIFALLTREDAKSVFRRDDGEEVFREVTQPFRDFAAPFKKVADVFHSVFGRELTDDDVDMLHALLARDEVKGMFRRDDGEEVFREVTQPFRDLAAPFKKVADAFHSVFGRELSEEDEAVLRTLFTREAELASLD